MRQTRLYCHVIVDIVDRKRRPGKWSVHAALVDGFHERQRYIVDAFDHECDNIEWLEFRGQRLAKVGVLEHHPMCFDHRHTCCSSGLYKAKNRLSRTFSFSPISSKNRLKKMLTSNSSLLHLNEKDNFNSMKRLSVPSRQVRSRRLRSGHLDGLLP